MKILFTILLLCVTLTSNTVYAQGSKQGHHAAARNYDPTTVRTINGTITAVEKQLHNKKGGVGVHLLVQTATEKVTVHLGPQWYIEQQLFTLAKGDKVEVEGSQVEMNGETVMIAKRIKKGAQQLELRKEDGTPLWSRQMQLR
ncbi:MAG: putative exported protein [Flavipsychrobacter sp.]|jgi:hypothetical protein|nr:putative exported protein [Flavipsychrobacter sp.]